MLKAMIWNSFVPEILGPKKCAKHWLVIYWPAKEVHISKKPHTGFYWFLHEFNDNKYSKMTGPEFWKKNFDPFAGGQNGSFRAQKSTLWKEAVKRLNRFIYFFFGVIKEPIKGLELNQVAYFQKRLFWVAHDQR